MIKTEIWVIAILMSHSPNPYANHFQLEMADKLSCEQTAIQLQFYARDVKVVCRKAWKTPAYDFCDSPTDAICGHMPRIEP